MRYWVLDPVAIIAVILAVVVCAIAIWGYVQLRNLAFLGKVENVPAWGVLAALARRLAQFQEIQAVNEQKLDAQRLRFSALLSLFELLDASSSIPEVLTATAEVVQKFANVANVTLRLYREEQHAFQIVAQTGITPEMVAELEWLPEDQTFPAEVKRTKQILCTSDLGSHPLRGGESPIRAGFKSLAVVPLIVREEVIGSMELGLKKHYEWSKVEQEWLMLIGRSVALSVNRMVLNEQLRKMTIEEERNWVAQEIHDGPAQLLGCIHMWLEEARELATEQDIERLQETISKIEDTTREAIASFREEMLGLRATPNSESMLPMVTDYLSRVREQWGIPIRLELSQTSGRRSTSFLTPAAETQAMRIVQEVLSNARRHANAKNITLRIEDDHNRCRIIVCDDGKGFDPTHVPKNHLGLGIIRERAASVGGRVEIRSKVGEGTEVEILLPKLVVGAKPMTAT